MEKLTLYYNPDAPVKYISKKDREDNPNLYFRFKNPKEIWNVNDLRELVTRFDFHNVLWRDYRNVYTNYIKADFLVMDVDDGYSIEQFGNDYSDIAYYLYTSQSNSPERNKYHVLFPLGKPILDKDEYKKYWQSLRRFFPFSCRGMRITNCLYGNPIEENFMIIANEGVSIREKLDKEIDGFLCSETELLNEKKVLTSAEMELALNDNINLILPRKGKVFYGLGGKCKSILAGKAKYEYPSRSEAEAAVIMTCIKNGWSFSQIDLLFKTEAKENTHYHDSDKKWIPTTYKSALDRYVDRNKVVNEAIGSFIENYDWSQGNQYTDKCISEIIFQIVKETGKTDGLVLSLGRLSSMAGMSRSTVKNALKRLSEIWLIRETINERSVRYSIDFERLCFIANEKEKVRKHINHYDLDIFTYRGLGKTGKLIFEYLLNNAEAEASEIQKDTGIGSINTIKTKLGKMENIGLVERNGKKWHLLICNITNETEAELARKLGVNGTIEERDLQYEKELRVWNDYKRDTYVPKDGSNFRQKKENARKEDSEQRDGIAS